MFKHLFINKLKVLLRTKSVIFWTLIFPIILGTFFNLAFSNLENTEKFAPVKVAIVNDDNFKNNKEFNELIKNISKENEDQVFISEYTTYEYALKLLDNNDVSGIIKVEDKINVIVKKNGLNETIIKYVVDSYYETFALVSALYVINPSMITENVINNYNTDNNFNDITSDAIDNAVVYFYTLIGMTCVYGGFFGINAVNETEANLSKKGARHSVSKAHKFKVLFSSLLSSLIIHFSEILILLSYLVFILKVDFGDSIIPIVFLSLVGSIAGISLGIFIGSIFKSSENTKTGILISVSMTFSFLSGMMIQQIKYLIDTYIPLFGYINPVNTITSALNSLYYYNDFKIYYFNIFCLFIFTITLLSISYLILRRKKYDSI